jgi:phage anti-repressor protein
LIIAVTLIIHSGSQTQEITEITKVEPLKENISNQEFLQRISMITEIIPVSVTPVKGGYKYEVDLNNSIIRDLKMALDLTEDQIYSIVEFIKFKAQYQEKGKVIEHYMMIEFIRELTLQEKERWNKAKQEFITMENTLLKKCHELRESLGNKETQFLDWVAEATRKLDKGN